MRVIQGDCLEQLKTLPDSSVDSLVTDPPAGISFMGKDWDGDKGGRKQWIAWMTSIMEECMRVLKPGAHGLVWALPRTSHWTATALEDAGFRVKDSILHCFGSGFPKSTNVKKQAEKAGIACVCDENVSDMRNDLDAEGSVSGDAQSDMQSHLLRKTGETCLHGSAKAETSVRGVRPDVSTKEPHRTRKSKTLLLSLQGRDQDGRSSDKSAAQADRFKHEGSKARASIRGKQPSVEGRNHLQTEQGQLHRAEVCQVSKRIPVDGSQGRLRDGAQASHGDAPRAPSKPSGMRASQGPQHSEQSDIESGMVSGQPITQACGRCGKTRIAEGYGSALKPAVEIWWLVQKPLEKNLTISANVLKWGCGALNIDASRIGYASEDDKASATPQGKCTSGGLVTNAGIKKKEFERPAQLGRFPANLVLSGDAPEMLDEQSGTLKSGASKSSYTIKPCEQKAMNGRNYERPMQERDASEGGASRFFYCAKISKSERNAGLDSYEQIAIDGTCREENTVAVQLLQKVTSGLTGKWSIAECGLRLVVQFPKGSKSTIEMEISRIIESKILSYLMHSLTKGCTPGASKDADNGSSHAANAEKLKAWLLSITKGSTELALGASRVASETLQKTNASDAKPCVNFHSTVKPKKLMAYLIRMVTPPGGTVLDPFMGSGSTGIAAKECGFDFIGIEREPEYVAIAIKRIESAVVNA